MEHAPHLSSIAVPNFGVRARLVEAVVWLEAVARTRAERRRLVALDDRALSDIGASRSDAHGEWTRPFWDLPGPDETARKAV
jgi:uncharacterized protein YjiS (DUF1127 family)